MWFACVLGYIPVTVFGNLSPIGTYAETAGEEIALTAFPAGATSLLTGEDWGREGGGGGGGEEEEGERREKKENKDKKNKD